MAREWKPTGRWPACEAESAMRRGFGSPSPSTEALEVYVQMNECVGHGSRVQVTTHQRAPTRSLADVP